MALQDESSCAGSSPLTRVKEEGGTVTTTNVGGSDGGPSGGVDKTLAITIPIAPHSPYTPTAPPTPLSSSQQHAATTTSQIISVIGSSLGRQWTGQGGAGGSGGGVEDVWLVQMLRDMLHGNSSGSEATSQVHHVLYCFGLACVLK